MTMKLLPVVVSSSTLYTIVSSILLGIMARQASCFVIQPHCHYPTMRTTTTTSPLFLPAPLFLAVKENGGNNNMNSSSDFPPEEETTAGEYKGSVDWDAEWKKVVQRGGTAATASGEKIDRPGKEFYKSEAEIAAIRAANKATESAAKLAASIPEAPSFDSLKGDWKFWVGLIALISVGTAILSAGAQGPPSMPSASADGSYYI